MNQLSHWLDFSQVYSSSDKEAKNLRQFKVITSKTSNDIVAGNGRVIKAYMFIIGTKLRKEHWHQRFLST